MTGRKKLAWWIFSFLIVLGAIALYLFLTKQPPPLNETATARESLSQAKNSKADIYAEDFYKKAECLYDSAMICWKRENQKPFYKKRDYSQVKFYSGLSDKESRKAIETALKQVSTFQVDLKSKLDSNRKLINKYDTIFRKVPLPEKVRNENNQGQLLLKQAELAFKNEQFVLCSTKVNEAELLLNNTYNYFTNYIRQYFSHFDEWKRLANATINQSKSGYSYTILIDKFARRCYLYQNGKIKHQFVVELGPNWIGEKNYRGDKRTPEGQYKITAVKNSKQTKFYKALLLNYPNAEDQERFRANKGNMPRHAKIGNLIEIHGNGGKQGDWTDGCIALTDSDMDILFRYVSVNMPVTIVGSLRPLSDILN